MKYLFPFDEVTKNSKVIIYGGGAVGRQFLSQILDLNYCDCLFVVDKNHKKLQQISGVEVCSAERIKNCDYDKIVIATIHDVDEIYDSLCNMGIPAEKIIRKVVKSNYGTEHAKKFSVDLELAELESVFKAPPMTNELAQAILLIAPHLNMPANEYGRAFWECEQNGSCWAEYECLSGILSELPKPMRVLEIGPGLGRSLVFFSKKLGWQDCDIHTYEGDGKTTKYTKDGPRFDDSFCGNISELRRVLEHNGMENVIIHDAKLTALKDVPGSFDLVYGFYNVGFHWSLEHFWDDILKLIGETGIAIFTIHSDFQPFAALQQLPYRILEKRRMSDDKKEKLIILGPQLK